MRQALDEALPAMAELRDSGAVIAIGVGVNEQAVCLELLPRSDLDCIMLAGRYTLFEQRAAEELLAHAHERSVKIIVAAPYNSGLLADSRGPGGTYDYKPVDASTLERARKIYQLCALEGVDVGAAALQFPLAHPAVASVVAGQRSAEEVTSAIGRLNARIPATLWARLKDVGLIDRSAVTPDS
jgi:D-threo-aldose 1-dehydrogenase